MDFYKYIFSPKLFREYGDSTQKFYEPNVIEKYSDQLISALNFMWSLGYYSSPLLITFLYRRGYFVAESVTSLAKFTTGIGLIVVVSLCVRGIGRQQNDLYTKFVKILESAKKDPKNASRKQQLRLFDFDFKDWPVDFCVKDVEGDGSKRKDMTNSGRNKPFWISTLPCQIAAYIAIHTFGLRMIYPGSLGLIQSYLHETLLQGRSKLIEEEKGLRYKVKTRDNNEIDTFFVDNRKDVTNGTTLVICSEGNAGFYEIGIMSTPLASKYSVLGWNHPGFGGSTGSPYPQQDQNAIDAVIQFAIHELGFKLENILFFGWSIGGYSSLWAASQYPDCKGVVLDATFDDVLQLALPRMPESLSVIVKIAIRDYVNLNNNDLIQKYSGPILLIRRTDDEIICSEDNVLATNRGNYLLINLLKYRFPEIFKTEQLAYLRDLLKKPLESINNSTSAHDANVEQLCLSLLMSYVSDNVTRKYPLEIGKDYTEQQRTQMALFLVRKYLLDYKSTHCTPLPPDYFQIPWDIPNDTDFVFT